MGIFGTAQRQFWGTALTGLTALRPLMGSVPCDEPHVFYGGAQGGARGGPQVKLDLLHKNFPEHWRDYNLVYLLSGALYLNSISYKMLKQQNIPIVVNQNGVFYKAWYPNGWERENARMARAIDASSHVFYQSQFCKMCADKFLGTTAKSYDILYNAVDTDFFQPTSRPKTTSHPFKFLITGAINDATFYRLVHAIQSLSAARKQGLDICVEFAGFLPNDLRATLQDHIDRANITGFFALLGSYNRSQAVTILQNADAYMMMKHNDPCPNAVLEALSTGLPVLYAASGGVPELVGPLAGIGLPVPETFEDQPTPDIQATVQAMARVIENRDMMAIAARTRAVENFDLKPWIAHHTTVFKKLLVENTSCRV
jgi:glycosyltransferase involved in cell wall biosynthesis